MNFEARRQHFKVLLCCYIERHSTVKKLILLCGEFLDRLVALLPEEHPQEVMEISNPRYLVDNCCTESTFILSYLVARRVFSSIFFYFRHEFEVSYQLDIHNICSDFQEDLQFHFSLGWRTILRKFVAPYNRRLAIVLGADVC